MHTLDNARNDPRAGTMLRATVRDGRGLREFAVADLSSRGLMGRLEHPPGRGEFVELKVSGHILAGHVRWVKGPLFGVALRDRVDVARVLGGKPPPRSPTTTVAQMQPPQTLVRTVASYCVMALAAGCAAYVIADLFIL
ncbi:PilZ domain-containing protein [Aurantiacibacter spongiae]|nr:PilZ domain-containing protein [Aurantiacibacter spongiae]